MVCLALELVGLWVVLGFNVGMEVFDELLSIKCSLESTPYSLIELGSGYVLRNKQNQSVINTK